MGIGLTGQLVPFGGGAIPLIDAVDTKGGYRAVADNTARDAIPSQYRTLGMEVYSIGSAAAYRLIGGLLNANWQLVPGGGSLTPLPKAVYWNPTGSPSSPDGSINAPFISFSAAITNLDGQSGGALCVPPTTYSTAMGITDAQDRSIVGLADGVNLNATLTLTRSATGGACNLLLKKLAGTTISVLAPSSTRTLALHLEECVGIPSVTIAATAIVTSVSIRRSELDAVTAPIVDLLDCKPTVGGIGTLTVNVGATGSLKATNTVLSWAANDSAVELYNCLWSPSGTLPTLLANLKIDDATRRRSWGNTSYELGVSVSTTSLTDWYPGGGTTFDFEATDSVRINSATTAFELRSLRRVFHVGFPRSKLIHNDSGSTLTIKNNYTTGTAAAYRIFTDTGADIVLPTGESATFVYSSSVGAWYAFACSGGGTGGIVTESQLRTAASGLTANLALNGEGIASMADGSSATDGCTVGQMQARVRTARVTAVSGTFTILATTEIIQVDTSAARTLNLPNPANGGAFLIKDVTGGAGTNNITLHRFGSETIEGTAADLALTSSRGGWFVWSDGTNWYVSGPP